MSRHEPEGPGDDLTTIEAGGRVRFYDSDNEERYVDAPADLVASVGTIGAEGE